MHHNQYEVFPGKQFRLMIGIYQSNLAGKGAHKKNGGQKWRRLRKVHK